jgi:hypothetical protein
VGDRANQVFAEIEFWPFAISRFAKIGFRQNRFFIFRICEFGKSKSGSTEPRKGGGPFLGSVEPYF